MDTLRVYDRSRRLIMQFKAGNYRILPEAQYREFVMPADRLFLSLMGKPFRVDYTIEASGVFVESEAVVAMSKPAYVTFVYEGKFYLGLAFPQSLEVRAAMLAEALEIGEELGFVHKYTLRLSVHQSVDVPVYPDVPESRSVTSGGTVLDTAEEVAPDDY